MNEKKLMEEQVNFIQNIKPLIRSSVIQEKDSEIIETTAMVNELIQRIEKVERLLEADQGERESARKAKTKEQIIFLLTQHKKLSSSQLSKLIGLSRTRCNEYFRELTREGITEGVIINRQKFYKLVKR